MGYYAIEDSDALIIPPKTIPSPLVKATALRFLYAFSTIEAQHGMQHLLLNDKKSGSFYICCHLLGEEIEDHADLETALSVQVNERNVMKRQRHRDNQTSKLMTSDALAGRSFEDIIVEYDTSTNPDKPIKVICGRDKIMAIREAVRKSVSEIHGLRVYFALSTEQRIEFAYANKLFEVPNDLTRKRHTTLRTSRKSDSRLKSKLTHNVRK